jgi:hypothetical protein
MIINYKAIILQLPLAFYNGPVFVPILAAQDETHGTRSYDAAWQADLSSRKTIRNDKTTSANII